MSDKSDNYVPEDKKDLQKGFYSSFQGQADFLLQEKVEKICHAVFFLIGRTGERSAGALVLEERALECVSIAAHFCITREGKPELLTTLLEIASLVRLGVTMGAVSEGSARVLVDEITKTAERIVRIGALPSVSSEDLQVQGDTVLPAPNRFPLSASLKELFAPRLVEESLSLPKKDISRTSSQKRASRVVGDLPVSDREGQVLAIVKEKGSVSIRDISRVITGCSEKTIQRTLLGLVERGTLKKEGERRWSTYRLA